MAIPKKILKELLDSLSLTRLKSVCRFAWASKCSTKEHFVDRYSTKTCVYTICEKLTHKELQRFADQLGVDKTLASDALLEKVKDAVWNYAGRKPDTSNKLLRCLQNDGNWKKAANVVWSRCDSLGWNALSQAEQIFVSTTLIAEEVAKKSVSGETMLFPHTANVPSDWPTPVIANLKRIGAKKSAAIVEAWITAAGLSKHKGQEFIDYLGEEDLDKASWTAKWKKNPEDIASLLKSYLLKNPSLF
jgi:hypothetical protein